MNHHGNRHTRKADMPARYAELHRWWAAGLGPSAIGRRMGIHSTTVLYHQRRIAAAWRPRNILVHNGAGL